MPSSSAPTLESSPVGDDAGAWGRQVQRRALEAIGPQVRAAWIAALLGVAALTLARSFGPGLAGVWVGSDRVVAWVELGAAIVAQAFALLGLASVLGLSLLLARGDRAVVVRALGVGVAGLVAMAMASAMFAVLPALSGLVAGVGAAAFALLVGGVALRRPGLRWLAALLVACALAGAIRMGSLGLLDWLEPGTRTPWARLAHGGVTAAAAFDALAIALGFGWLVGPRLRLGRLLLVGLAVALALAWTWGAARGAELDATGVLVWSQRALGRLAVGPPGDLPMVTRMAVEATVLTLAAVALARPASSRLGAAVVALALVGRGALEAPSCALALLLAALLVATAIALDDARPRGEQAPSGVASV